MSNHKPHTNVFMKSGETSFAGHSMKQETNVHRLIKFHPLDNFILFRFSEASSEYEDQWVKSSSEIFFLPFFPPVTQNRQNNITF